VPLFDAYLIVDWSASAIPKKGRDSIWIGFGRRRGRSLQMAPSSNPLTRVSAVDEIQPRLEALVAERCRVLVGFDFPYAYPSGLARALGWRPEAQVGEWRFTWDRIIAAIRDAPDNANNRFAVASALNAEMGRRSPGPFWGGPPRCETATFKPTSPPFPYALEGLTAPLARHRLAEQAMRERGQQVQETWKLLGRGSVGSQALMGIPRVAALRAAPRLAPHSRVWPFETGFVADPEPGRRPFLLHAEIWPRVAPFEDDPTKVKDEIQVECLVRWLAQHDDDGALGTLLDAPPRLADAQRMACVREEGWILGA
jgi:hypothetical protein